MEDQGYDQQLSDLIDRNVNLHKYKQQLIDKHFLTPEKLFLTPIESIAFQTNVPIDVCKTILQLVSKTLITVNTGYCAPEIIPRFGDTILDSAMPLPPSGIIELAGLAGSGKTNLIFQIAIIARISFPSRPVVFLSTEGKVPTQRLQEIAQSLCVDSDFNSILNGISISEVDSVLKLSQFVNDALPPLFTGSNPPSLIIIDSIAALFRLEFNEKNAPEKTRILFGIATTLKWLSEFGNCGVFVTNQATANMGFGIISGVGPDWVPALGFSWSNCINVRLKVTKTQAKREFKPNSINSKEFDLNIPQMVPVRTLFAEISPIRQDVKCDFVIDATGVHGI